MKLIRRQLLQVAGAAVAALGVNSSSGAESTVVGNWKLVSFVSEELATGKKIALLGEHPKGYLIYTPQGRMMAIIVHETRSPPKVDEDRINLHKYMYAYSGRYAVEGEKVVHHLVERVLDRDRSGPLLQARRRQPHDHDRPTKECNLRNRIHCHFSLGTRALNHGSRQHS